MILFKKNCPLICDTTNFREMQMDYGIFLNLSGTHFELNSQNKKPWKTRNSFLLPKKMVKKLSAHFDEPLQQKSFAFGILMLHYSKKTC